MFTFLIAIVCFVAGGFLRRIAGGLAEHWTGPLWGTQVSRLIQAGGMGLMVYLLSWNVWWGIGTVSLVFAGATWGFPRLQLSPFKLDMKNSHMVPENMVDTLGLSFNGFVATMPLAVGVALIGNLFWWLISLAGLARGPAYWAAAAYTPAWHWMEFEVWNPDQLKWTLAPVALTEFYSGGLFALATMLAILLV